MIRSARLRWRAVSSIFMFSLERKLYYTYIYMIVCSSLHVSISLVRTVGHHVRVEKRRGHVTQITVIDHTECVPDPERYDGMPDKGQLER